MTTTVKKQPAETILTKFDFSSKMSASEVIGSVDSTFSTPADITFGTTTTNSQDVEVLISGGDAPSREDIAYTPYKLTMIVTTNLSQVLEKDIFLNVQDN